MSPAGTIALIAAVPFAIAALAGLLWWPLKAWTDLCGVVRAVPPGRRPPYWPDEDPRAFAMSRASLALSPSDLRPDRVARRAGFGLLRVAVLIGGAGPAAPEELVRAVRRYRIAAIGAPVVFVVGSGVALRLVEGLLA